MHTPQERLFATHDGSELFYRFWPAATGPTDKAVVFFHRGHEHSGRLAHLADDKLSQVKAAQIPGVGTIEDEMPQPDATIAMVVPYFQSILSGERLGLHNIYPDADGVVRQYTVFRADYGWAIPSLPATPLSVW